MLEWASRASVIETVTSVRPAAGDAVEDVGFGGGVGLHLLIRALGPSEHVVGVEDSKTMIGRAERRFGREIAAKRLRLHEGSMTQLPLETEALDGAIRSGWVTPTP